MKTIPTPLASAFAALLPTLLLASPALAQQAQTTPPPVVQLAPAAAAPEAAPPAAPVTTQTVTPPPVVATVSDPSAAAVPEKTAPAARTARSTPRAAAVRAAPRTTPRAEPVRTAPVAATPVAPAPVVDEPTAPPATAPVATAPAANPAPTGPDAAPATQTTTTTQQTAIWPWIVGALVVLGGIVALMLGRRRREAVYDEPVVTETYAEPVADPVYVAPIAAPLAAEPVMREPQYLDRTPVAAVAPVAMAAPTPAESAEIVAADDAEVEALTAGTPTTTDRPWLEFAMRPVRAGTNVDEAMVEVELTVGNAGSVTAEDVRIATFMFASEPVDAAAFERMLIERDETGGEHGMSDPVSIAAGEGTRLDATLAVPRGSVADLFNPVVVADARYRLPDGSEGRTLASFTIGRTDAAGDFGPIANERAMHEDVEARLYAAPEHV